MCLTESPRLRHEFVELVPEVLEGNVLYISIKYRTAVHLCCCGCGVEVATPLSPAEWQLTFDGETVTLYPSIGNWNLNCRSHYWIRRDRVEWARTWTAREVAKAKQRDRSATEKQFAVMNKQSDDAIRDEASRRDTLWDRIWKRLS